MGEKVAVLLCGYGEVEEYDEFAEYNERSFKLLVSKSIKFPDFSIPFFHKQRVHVKVHAIGWLEKTFLHGRKCVLICIYGKEFLARKITAAIGKNGDLFMCEAV